MTVSSPPSRPDPDGGEIGSGNGRSPPPPASSNSETNSNNGTTNSQPPAAGNSGTSEQSNKQLIETNINQCHLEQENIEAGANISTENSQTIPKNDSAGTFQMLTLFY